MNKRIIIIGAGAAGMMTAAILAEKHNEAEITLVERNPRMGQKVIISGGGRCNVTTGVEDLKEVLKAYPRGAKFIRTAFYAFPPRAMRDWVESHGVPLKKEADLRIFPRSNKGTDVVGIFEKILKDSDVRVMCKRVVNSVAHDGEFKVELNTGEVLSGDYLVITTGGQAYKRTGSKGDGYSFAQALGHSITKLAPSLTAFTIQEQWVRDLAGVSFPEVRLRFIGAEKYEFAGPIMFTHKGVTGPAIFALSAMSAFESLPATLEFDFFPQKNHEQLSAQLKKVLAAAPKKQFHNSLSQLIPHSFSKLICDLNDIPLEKRNNELSKKDINRTIQRIKQLSLKIKGRSPGEEFVTAGGVDLKEVDPKSFQSKIQPGLFFAGEVLNIDGFTGGYNLHAAWAGGHLVGESLS